MAVNRGKSFEDAVRKAFEKVAGVSIDRLHDQTSGYRGSSNICDFIVYKKPYELYIECKSVHGNTLSIYSNDNTGKGEVYGNITKKQWEGLLSKSEIKGVTAGVLCWWVDKGITAFLPISFLDAHRHAGYKSINPFTHLDNHTYNEKCGIIILRGNKKRVFYDYDMDDFLHQLEKGQRGK